MGWGAACSWGHSPAALIPPRATSSLLPPTPTPPGRLAMIVTEYMENGSLDAFLRVRAPFCIPCGPGEGSSVWVMGDHERPPNTPHPQSLGLTDLGKEEPGMKRVSPCKCLSAPHHVKAPLLWVLPPCSARRLSGASVRTQGPTQWGSTGRGPETPRFPAFAGPCVCWVVRDRAAPLWVSLSPWAKWMTSPHTPPAYLSGLLGG